MEQRTEEWYEARKGLVTASAVGGILGLAPYATSADVMRRMVRDAHGAESEFTGNIATEYGKRNEPAALIDYSIITGHNVAPGGWHTRDEWAGASPDGLIGADGLLEIKCPFGIRKDIAPEFKTLADQPHYYAQVQFQLWVTGRDWAHFFQWSAFDNKLETVLQDAEWQAVNLPLLRMFWEEYRAVDPAPHLADRRVEIDGIAARKVMAEYEQICEAIENATARKSELITEMVRLAGDKNAVFAGRNLTKVEKAGAISYAKALAKYAPDADIEPFRGKPSVYWQVK